jgi:hypothetical protein
LSSQVSRSGARVEVDGAAAGSREHPSGENISGRINGDVAPLIRIKVAESSEANEGSIGIQGQ